MGGKWALGLCGLVVGLLAGIGLGWWLASQGQAGQTSAPATVADGTRVDDRPPAASSVNRPKVKAEVPEGPAAASGVVETPPPRKADLPAPDAELSGSVVFDDGKVAAGLRLRALPEVADSVPLWVKDAWDLERRMEYEAAMARTRFEAATETTTDDAGSFVLPVSSASRYQIRCLDPQVVLVWGSTVHVTFSAPTKDITLKALRLVEVHVEVKYEDNTAPATANLSLTWSGAPFQAGSMVWSAAQRKFLLPAGKIALSARLPQDPSTEGSTSLTLPVDQAAPEVVIVLKRPLGLTVTVIQPSPYYADVGCGILGEEHAKTESMLLLSIPRLGHVGQRIPPNQYFFKAPEKGNYLVLVHVNSAFILHRANLAVTGGAQNLTIELQAPKRDEHMVVRLFSPDGKPVGGAKVMMALDHPDVSIGDLSLFMAAGAGEYWIRRPEPELARFEMFAPAEECGLSIRATHRQWGTVFKSVPFNAKEADIHFGGVGDVTVRISNLPAEPVANVVVSVVPEGAAARREISLSHFQERPASAPTAPGRSPLQAVTQFRGVPVGPATLYLFKLIGAGQSGVVLASKTISVTATGVEETLELPGLYDLVVIPDAPLGRLDMTLSRGDGWTTMIKLEDGTCVARQLPEGDYLISVGGRGMMAVRLPASGPVKFEPKPAHALRVSRYDALGIYYRAGLRVGDVITAFDGQALEESQDLRALRREAAKRQTLTLDVVRDGKLVQVVLRESGWQAPFAGGEGLSGIRTR
ncbi:PDZ domain-containing protein [bacterium]|nr:MAG: PDZ domain-containing protein [bacterium]RIK62053.1 MAG: hypothetical protein DCC64_11090 [Planctomycetota bacterium]